MAHREFHWHRAYLIGLWIEALFYGINSFLVWTCLFIFVYKRERRNINKFLVTLVIFQYLISTTDVSLGLRGLIVEFTDNRSPSKPNGSFHSGISVVSVQGFFMSVNSLLNNCVIVWRCYHVWGKNLKVVSLPIVLILATIAGLIGQTMSFRTDREHIVPYNHKILSWNFAFFACSFSTTFVGTTLAAFRIWSLTRRSLSMRAHYTRLLILLIESGMLYSAFLIIALIVYLSEKSLAYIFYAQFGQLASIIPTMIMLLVGLRLTSDNVQWRTVTLPSAENSYRMTTNAALPLNNIMPVVINVTTSTIQSESFSDGKTLALYNKEGPSLTQDVDG